MKRAIILWLASAAMAIGQEQYAWTNFVGQPGNPGSADGMGITARFDYPYGVAVDNAGNLYVTEYGNCTIRKVTPAGVVTTLAGSAGLTGSADGTGSAARFNHPYGIAVDSAGNLYVSDEGNHTIRKVTSDGVVTTLAGSAGSAGSADGSGDAARFCDPTGIALDSGGNLYVAEWGNCTIRKVTQAGVVTTLAGSAGSVGSADGTGSAARFYCPSGVALDNAGYLYVADTYNYTIRKVTLDGVVTTLAGSPGSSGSADGTGSGAQFNNPGGVATDSAGNLYVADYSNHTIRRVTSNGVVTTLGGSASLSGCANGLGSAARFYCPSDVAVNTAGDIYVADEGNQRISKSTPEMVSLAPTVTGQPQNRTNLVGSTASFFVTATGGEPLTFQWFENGVPLSDDERISGTRSQTLTINNAAVSDSGQYWAIVSNAFGVTNSVVATVLVQQVQQWAVAGSQTNSDEISKGIAVNGNLAYVANGYVYFQPTENTGLRIYDVGNPANPVRLGECRTNYAEANRVTVSGTRAYVALGTSPPFGLGIVDVSNPSTPSFLGVFDTSATVQHGRDVVVSGTTVYLADGEGLQVFDVDDPTNIVLLGSWTNWVDGVRCSVFRVVLSRNVAYVAGSGLHIVNVSDPTNPVLIGGTSASDISSVAVSGNLAYTVASQVLRIYDVSDPSNLIRRGSISLNNAMDITLSGNTAYVACGSNGVTVVDVSNPATPAITGAIATRGEANSLVIVGDLAYVADGSAGLTIISLVTNSAPSILEQPQRQTIATGGAALFSVTANGTSPLRYRWLFTNAPLAGATNSLLWLTNAQVSQVGEYSVIVSNYYGSVTSSVAALTIQAASQFSIVPDSATRLPDGRFQFQLSSDSGAILEVEASTNLTYWETIGTITNSTGLEWFIDSSTNFPRRFFRLKLAGFSSSTNSLGDDFRSLTPDNTKWGPDLNFSVGGQLVQTNGQLQFTGNGSTVRPWIGNYGSYTQNWEVIADVNLGNITLTQNVSHAQIFLGVANHNDTMIQNGLPGDNFSIALDLDRDSLGVSDRGFEAYLRTNWVEITPRSHVNTSSQQASLRISFDAATKTLTAWYDPDASANGYSWTLLRSAQVNVSASDWEMDDNSAFEVFLGASAEDYTVTDSDEVYADNFVVNGGVASGTPFPNEGGDFAWAKRVASTENPDNELAIGFAMDSTTNLYVTGWFDGTNDFGGVTLTNDVGGGQDIFVAKYNSDGALQWARRAGGNTANWDTGRGVGVDNAGSVYVTGGFWGTADFGGYNLTAKQDGDFFLAKYNSAGAAQWVQQSAGGGHEAYGTGIAVDGNGTSYVVGYYDGSGITFGGTTLDNAGDYNAFLVKYDSAGTLQWAKSIGSSDSCYSTSVAVDANGYVYVTGNFYTSLSVGTTNLTSVGEKDGFVAKFNSAGTLQWVEQMGGTSDDAGLGSTAVDTSGNVFVVGGFGNTNGDRISFGAGITLTNIGGGVPGTGVGDAYLAKYNAAGAIQWAKRAGGTNMDAYTGVSSDAQGNVYVAGGTGGYTIPGGFNVVMAKYDTNGITQWTQSSTGTNGALAFGGPFVDSGGNCYIAGWFHSNVVFGTNILTGNGYWDLFIAKLASSTPMPVTPITIRSVTFTNSILEISFTNTPGTPFSVLATTNVALPLSNWIVLGDVTEVSPSQFKFTDTQAMNNPQRFYRIRSP